MGEDLTRFGHSACQDMVHSCDRLKRGEISRISRCILHFGKSCFWTLFLHFHSVGIVETCAVQPHLVEGVALPLLPLHWPSVGRAQEISDLMSNQKKCWGGVLVRLISTCMFKTLRNDFLDAGVAVYRDPKARMSQRWSYLKLPVLKKFWKVNVEMVSWEHLLRNTFLVDIFVLNSFSSSAPSFAKSLPASEALNDPARLALRFPMATRFVATIACYFVATGAEDAPFRCQQLDLVNGGRLKLTTKRCSLVACQRTTFAILLIQHTSTKCSYMVILYQDKPNWYSRYCVDNYSWSSPHLFPHNTNLHRWSSYYYVLFLFIFWG